MENLPLIGTTLFGCCSSVVCLELLIKDDSGVGNLVTLCAFIFISVDGFFNGLQMGHKKLQVPGRNRNCLFYRNVDFPRIILSNFHMLLQSDMF